MKVNNRTASSPVLTAAVMLPLLIACTDTLKNSLVIVYVFSIVTILTVILSPFVPERIPAASRTVIYMLIASLIYVPVKMTAVGLWHDYVNAAGIYCPLAAVNFLTAFRTDAGFVRPEKIRVIIKHTVRFDILMIVMALVREFLAYGTVNSIVTDFPVNINGISQSCGGFICLGLLCGLYRRIKGDCTDVSDK